VTVVELVERERAHLRRWIALAGAGLAVGAAALLLVAGVLTLAGARWIELPRWVPLGFWLLVGAAAAAVGAWTSRRIRRDASRAHVAAVIEQERALRAGALRGTLEVAEQGALGRRAAERLGAELAAVGPALAPASRRASRVRATWLLGGALALALLLGVTSTTFADGWRAVAHPVAAWRGTLLPRLALDAPRQVLRGERATVALVAPGRERVTLHRRATGAAWGRETHALRDGRARLTLAPADADLTLVLDDGRTTSDTVLIEVAERPFLADVALRAVYPAYLGRAPEPLAAGEVARVPRGTVVSIEGRASTALARVELVRGASAVQLPAAGQRFGGRLTALESGTWQWRAIGPAGPIADVPPALALEVVPDSAPRVEILAPARDTVVTGAEPVAVSVVASDDHGLAQVTLRSWRVLASGAAQPEVAQRLGASPGAQWSGEASIDVAARGLEAGDALHVVAVASDASPWRQAGVSHELVLRVPGLAEQRQLACQAADSAVAGATALAAAQRQLQQRTSEVARSRGQRKNATTNGAASASSRGGGSPLSYESAEQAKALAREQRDLAQRVQELQQQAKALENQLRQAGALDSGLAARLHEAQRLLRDALTPQLAEQLQKLQEAAQQLEGDETRQALGDLAAQQQALREQIERSLEMLKRAALEGSMETLRDEAKELAQKQAALADSLERGQREPPTESTRKLSDRSRDLSRQVADLAKRLEQEKAEAGARRAREAQEHARESADQLQRVAEHRAGEPRDERRDPQPAQQPAQQPDQDREASEAGERAGAAERAQTQPEQPAGTDRNSQRDSADRRSAALDSAQRTAARDTTRPDARPGAPQQSRDAQSGAQREADERAAGEAPPQDAGPQGQQAERGEQQAREGTSERAPQRAPRNAPRSSGQRSRAGNTPREAEQEAAREAADQMEQAAQQLADAREAQVEEWKEELTAELDRSIQEMLQMGREESALADETQQGADQASTSAKQSAVRQGVQQAGQRLQKQGQKSSLVSSRSQRAVSEAQQKVDQAGREAAAGNNSAQTAAAMRDAAESLNRAAASLVRDRERANSASSASGFSEMLQEMQELAKQQGQLNSQSSGLSMLPGGAGGSQAQAAARALARRQRALADALEEAGEGDGSGRSAELAKEARQLAQALARGAPDAATLDRQQRLYRRLLDAGKTLEQDERDETGKREAKAATGTELFNPGTDKASGRAAARFREPTWNELRGLSAEERRLVLEYFKRINAEP